MNIRNRLESKKEYTEALASINKKASDSWLNLLGVLYKTAYLAKICHWNYKGNTFSEYHQMFDSTYYFISTYIDAAAEMVSKYDEDIPTSLEDLIKGKDISVLSKTPYGYLLSITLAYYKIVRLTEKMHDEFKQYNDANSISSASKIEEINTAMSDQLWKFLNCLKKEDRDLFYTKMEK